MEEEIWEDIKEFNGYYQVSNFGRVKSKERTVIRRNGKKQPIPEKILKPLVNKAGYLKVRLYGESLTKTKYVHVLVAETFIGEKPNNSLVVCHIDGDKLNNDLSNLRYGSYLDNYLDAVKQGKIILGEDHQFAKLTKEDVKKIKSLQKKLNQTAIAKQFGISQQQVSRILRDKNWKWLEEDNNANSDV